MATESTILFTAVPNSTIDEALVSVQTRDPIVELVHSIQLNLWIYWCPVLIFGGTLSNGLSLLVLRCPEFRHTTMAFTLSALAVSDTGVLYTGALRRWVLALTRNQVDYVVLSLPSCRIFYFFTYLFPQLSSWTTVLVTVERVVSVRFPFRAKSLCTRCKMICAWFVILVALIGFNVHFLWNLVVVRVNDDGMTKTRTRFCEFRKSDLDLYNIVYWIDFVLLAALPCTVIIVSNIIIILTLAKRRTKRLQQQNSETNSSSDSRQNMLYRSLTTTLLVVSFVFILTTLPITIYFRVATREVETNLQAARLSLAYAICNLLYYTSNAINFFLYVLTGHRFRRAFMKQLIKLKCLTDRQKSPDQNGDSPLQAVLLAPGGVSTNRTTVLQESSTLIC